MTLFGIIQYEKIQEQRTNNGESTNGGSVATKDLDKETTIIIEKLAKTTTFDELKNELKLDTKELDNLEATNAKVKFAPLKDSSSEKLAVQSTDKKIDVIYEVKNGKLEKTDKKASDEVKDSSIKWTTVYTENKKHNKDEAEKITNKYINAKLGGVQVGQDGTMNILGLFAYLGNPNTRIHNNVEPYTSVCVLTLEEAVDIYNTAFPKTYSEDEVKKDIDTNLVKENNLIELDEVYSKDKILDIIKKDKKMPSNLYYFKNNKTYALPIGGIGGYLGVSISDKNQWKEQDDRLMIPLNTFNNKIGEIILKLNNKKYEGGVTPSKYYIEKVDIPY